MESVTSASVHKSAEAKVPRVLLVGPSLGGGGAEKRFANLCSAVFKGHVDVCVLQADGNPDEPKQNEISSLNWKGDYSYPRMVLLLRRKIKSGNYDVVVGFGPHPNILVWAATRFMRRPKTLLTEITKPWTSTFYRSSWLIRNITRLLLYAAYSTADLMAANSIDGMNECVKFFGVRGNSILRLPNLLDAKEIEFKAALPLTVDWPHNSQVITMAARLDRMKRVDVLLEAVSLLPSKLNWFVAVIGDGPELHNLRRQAEELKVSHRVAFLGWIDNPYPIIKESTVCVLCSEFEGFSNWVLEAMFVGTPVVTAFCSSDARLMCEAGAALGFEPGDAVSLSQQLSLLLNSKQTREAMTNAAHKYSNDHELSQGILTYEQAIQRVASNGHF